VTRGNPCHPERRNVAGDVPEREKRDLALMPFVSVALRDLRGSSSTTEITEITENTELCEGSF
jgi:hypothetical protein